MMLDGTDSRCAQGRRPLRPTAIALTAIVALSITFTNLYAGELVTNGRLTAGVPGQPAGWRHEALFNTTDAVNFEWIPGDSHLGVLKISNLKPNDSRWIQTLPVSPGTWYHVTGWMRTEGVGTVVPGAYIVDLHTNAASDDLRGTHDWQATEFWFRTDPDQTTVELACRVGGYSALNTGTAYFTAISAVPSGGFPEGAEHVYGASVLQYFNLRLIIFMSAMILLATAIFLCRFVMGSRST
jgi:hypothetical protein